MFSPESSNTVLYIPPAAVWRYTQRSLGAAAWPWKPISWSSQSKILVLKLLSKAVWKAVASDARKDKQFLRAMHFSTRWLCSVSLHGLLLHGWIVVAPRCFIIIALILIDWGRCFTNWLVVTVESCDRTMFQIMELLTVSHNASVSLWRLPGYVLDFMHVLATGVSETLKLKNSDWVQLFLAIKCSRSNSFRHFLIKPTKFYDLICPWRPLLKTDSERLWVLIVYLSLMKEKILTCL